MWLITEYEIHKVTVNKVMKVNVQEDNIIRNVNIIKKYQIEEYNKNNNFLTLYIFHIL